MVQNINKTPLGAPPPFPPGLVTRTASRIRTVVTNITIEPATFLISFSNALDDISVKKMLIYKSCKTDFEFNNTVCDNLLTNYTHENDMIQDEIAQFNVYQDIVTSIIPIFFSFYLGAWCDTFGRKLCMFLFVINKCIGQAILVYFSYNIDLPKEWYLVTFVPITMIGGYAAFSMGTSAFIADISPPDQRAFRMGMIHLSQTCGRPIGTKLGAYILKHGGYVGVTSASLGGLTLGGIFLYFRMRSFHWTRPQTQVDRSAFSLYHVREAVMVTFKKRPQPNRKYLYILMLLMIIQFVPHQGETSIDMLYVRTRFGWDVDEYSNYNSIILSVGIVAQSFIIPSLSLLGIRDSLILMIVLASSMMRQFIKGFSKEPWMFYLAALVDPIGNYSTSLIRAMLTCCVPLSEFGKIYSVMSSLDHILPLGLAQAYASIWKATSEYYPGAAFLMSGGFSVITLSLAIYVHFSLRGKRFSEAVRTEEINKELGWEGTKSIFDISSRYYDEIYTTTI